MNIAEEYFKNLEEIGAIRGSIIGAGTSLVMSGKTIKNINRKINNLKDKISDTNDKKKVYELKGRIQDLKDKRKQVIKLALKKGAIVGAAGGAVAGIAGKKTTKGVWDKAKKTVNKLTPIKKKTRWQKVKGRIADWSKHKKK